MNNKVAIITAASKGIGAACARVLKSRGYKLVLMSRSDGINAVAKDLNALACQGSVTNKDDLEKLVNLTIENYGRIDAVVNNTGHPAKGQLLELSDQDWKQGLDLILLNVTRIAQLVVPHMEKNGGGSFVNISTYAALEPSPNFPVSSVLRAALASYTKLFSSQYAHLGIRMNAILPGYADSYPVDGAALGQIPMGRPAKVEEIANAVAYLLSEEASYITGQNIKVDGGISRSI